MLRIKELRTTKNLTQKDLAIKIDSTDKSIWAYENSVAFPPIETLTKLADFFGCSIDYLVGREDDFGNVVINEDLTENEKTVLRLFRAMPEARQRTVLDLLEDLSGDSARKRTGA